MKKILVSILIIAYLIFGRTIISYAEVERYTTTKIKLGNYQIENGKPVLSDYSVRWWELEPFNIAVDDNHYIYILDIYNRKVVKLMPNGNLTKKIELKEITFPYIDRAKEDGYMNYMIQVSSDGSFIYAIGGSNEFNWTIYDGNGNVLKKDMEVLSSFRRICNDRFATDSDILDTSLKSVKQITKHVFEGEIFDSEYSFYSIDNRSSSNSILTKKGMSRQDLWKREIKGYEKAIRLLGVDGKDNIYVLVDGPPAITKLNKKGELISDILLPHDSVFTGHNFLKGIFEIVCDGSFYYFPPYLGPLSRDQKKIRHEYSIYKFQKTGSVPPISSNPAESPLDFTVNFFKSKVYEGNVKVYSDIGEIIPQSKDDTKSIFVKALRNEIYARHGRIFTTPEMKRIFEAAPWYKPRGDFKESDLNEIEKKNVELIIEYEKKMGWK